MRAEITAGQVSDYKGYDAVMDGGPEPEVFLAGNGRDGERPTDRQPRVKWRHPAFVARCVVCVVQVDQFDMVAQRLEPVCEAARNEQATAVFFAEDYSVPCEKCRRSGAKVHRYIEHITG